MIVVSASPGLTRKQTVCAALHADESACPSVAGHAGYAFPIRAGRRIIGVDRCRDSPQARGRAVERMITLIDEWVGRVLGIPIEPGLRVPTAVAAGLLVAGTIVFTVATTLLARRQLRRRD